MNRLVKEITNLVEENYYKKYSDPSLLDRCYKEIEILDKKNQLYLIHLLYKYKKNFTYLFKGTINNLFIMYVLGLSRVNPLPSHYYCKKCKTINMEKICPKCHKKLTKDGYNLYYELYNDHAISVDIMLDCYLSFVYTLENDEDNFGLIKGGFERGEDEDINELEDNHFFIIPKDENSMPLKFNEYGILETIENYHQYDDKYPIFIINDKTYYVGDKVGMSNLMTNSFEKKLCEKFKPKTVEDYAKIKSIAHAAHGWMYNQEEVDDKINLNNMIASRDDVMDYLINHNINKDEAVEITNFIRRGRPSRNKEKWEEYVEIMKKHNCEDFMIEVFSLILYLPSRGTFIGQCLFAKDKKYFISTTEHEEMLKTIEKISKELEEMERSNAI